jgi:hypothetical protein
MVAYDNGSPVAICEDKNERAALVVPTSDYSIKTVKELANLAARPFFGRRIASDFSWMTVVPLNTFAKAFPPPGGFRQRHSEAEHVVWRYRLAGRSLSAKQAQTIINEGIAQQLDKPLIRSAFFSNIDDADAIDYDLEKLDAMDLIKLLSAINRRIGVGR